jgi:hypothetical protein
MSANDDLIRLLKKLRLSGDDAGLAHRARP